MHTKTEFQFIYSMEFVSSHFIPDAGQSRKSLIFLVIRVLFKEFVRKIQKKVQMPLILAMNVQLFSIQFCIF